jgi:hypothetical protein
MQEVDVVLGPVPGLRVDDAEGADTMFAVDDHRNARVRHDAECGEGRVLGQNRVGAGVLDHERRSVATAYWQKERLRGVSRCVPHGSAMPRQLLKNCRSLPTRT